MSSVQARSKTIVLIAAVARNGVIGQNGGIPWHLPDDFRHFKVSTINQTVLMGRATFESIGRPLADRQTLVLTRDRSWNYQGVHIAHDLQSAIDIAEDLPGNLMVVGGSHIYASTISVAHMQILSEIHQEPIGDTFYPPWDQSEWQLGERRHNDGFDITWWHRKPRQERLCSFSFPLESAALWWSDDWTSRLERAVTSQKVATSNSGAVDWAAVHQAAMRVIVEAAEDHARRGLGSSPGDARKVRLNGRLSMQDVQAIQGALLHWSDFIAPRHRVD